MQSQKSSASPRPQPAPQGKKGRKIPIVQDSDSEEEEQVTSQKQSKEEKQVPVKQTASRPAQAETKVAFLCFLLKWYVVNKRFMFCSDKACSHHGQLLDRFHAYRSQLRVVKEVNKEREASPG